jgi:hypothetical protein
MYRERDKKREKEIEREREGRGRETGRRRTERDNYKKVFYAECNILK